MTTLLSDNPDKSRLNLHEPPPMAKRDFNVFRNMILEEAGISLEDSKCELLRNRLRKRLAHHGLNSFDAYIKLLENDDPQGLEKHEFINCLTTNKTDFFRESHHFEFLTQSFFPERKQRARTAATKKLRIWSAACSTGEEPYSIAMSARDTFGLANGWDIKILASDIDSNCLRTAAHGIYPERRVEHLPLDQKKRSFLRGSGDREGTVRIQPELREMIRFRRINFADRCWPIQTKFDVIFCRNALIYFERNFQAKLIRRFLNYVHPNGYLIFGHSENLSWMPELEPVGQTIYRPKASTSVPDQKVEAGSNQTTLPVPSVLNPNTDGHDSMSSIVEIQRSCSLDNVPKREIVAGEYFASDQTIEIATLLGSCVAACLHDPQANVGGMNHFLLPVGRGGSNSPATYGINAMELLITEIMKLGGQRNRLTAKLYGGANVLGKGLSDGHVGESNLDFVRKYLKTEGIPILGHKTGGTQGIRVVMTADSGAVVATKLAPSQNASLIQRESSQTKPVPGQTQPVRENQITLF